MLYSNKEDLIYMSTWESRFGDSLHSRLESIVLSIGEDKFTRRDVATKLRCLNVVAAGKLDRVVRKFNPQNVEDLAKRMTVDHLFSIEGVGSMTLYVWLNVLTYKGLSVEDWLNNNLSVSAMYRDGKKARTKKRSKKYR